MGAASGALVGRARELELLEGWLDAARAGSGRLVLCAGEPGIGKTRLAQELAGRALARGTAVAWARCAEADGGARVLAVAPGAAQHRRGRRRAGG